MSSFLGSRLSLLALISLASGCQSGGETSGIDGTGARGPVVAAAYGRVTGSGDFVVNGVRYDTTNMAVVIDGAPATVADVKTGDVVLVTGTLESTSASNGVAQKAVLEHAVVGPVESVDSAGEVMVALGQTVRIAEATFDASIPGSTLEGVSIGDVVAVSGFRDQASVVIASRISRQATSVPSFRAGGRIANLDAAARRFNINGLTVDYATAQVSPGPSGTLLAGDLVEVSGTSLWPTGELAAATVAVTRTDVIANVGDYVNLEGYVTALDTVNPDLFEVAGLPIMTTSTTVRDGTIAYGARAEVRGALGGNGALVANDVRTDLIIPPGVHTVEGVVFDGIQGHPVPNVFLGIWTRISGQQGWFATTTSLYTDANGHFRVIEVPHDAQLWLHASPYASDYYQPCAVTLDVRSDLSRDVEVVSRDTLNSLAAPWPITAREPTITGTVYEMTPAGRQPVAGAYVVADGAAGLGLIRAGTLTDLNGHYMLCELPEGMVLQVYKDRYVVKEIFPVGGPASATIDIEIERQ